MADKLMDVKIMAPDRVFYEGKVSFIEFNTTEGILGIYPKHIPMTVVISPGVLKIVEENGDIKEAASIFGAASFDVVTCNPPYMIGQHGIQNPDAPKAIARHEILCTLEDVISQAAKLCKPGGHFYMVHRPFRLAEIISLMTQYRLEPKRMQLVYPFVDKEPNMVLIEGVRGGRSRMTVEKPLIVYKEPGVYMPEIYEVYGY